jgi:hypothetical protein
MDSPVRPVSEKPSRSPVSLDVPIQTKIKVPQSVINVGGPRGLEKIILLTQIGVRKFQRGLDQVFYGKPDAKSQKNKDTKIANPLDLGITNLIDLLVSVDYCDIINYALLNTNVSKNSFDIKKPPKDTASWQEKQVYKLKKLAYEIQTIIDEKETYLANNDASNRNDVVVNKDEEALDETQKKKQTVFNKISKIRAKFDELKKTIAPEKNQIQEITSVNISTSSTNIVNAFPQLRTILPSIEDKLQYLNKWSDYRQIPISDYQKIVNTIDKIKVISISIQGLSVPADFFNLLPNKMSKDVADKIAQVTKVINPAQAIPTIKKLIQTLEKINLIIKKILNVVGFLNTITKVLLLFIKIIKKLLIFFGVNPTPSMFVTFGLISVTEDGKQKVKEQNTKFEDRLTQIAYLFQVIFQACTSIALEITLIIAKLKILIANLQKCQNVEDSIVNSLQAQTDELENNLARINKFIDTKLNSSTNSPNNRIGEYTIQIVTEEVIDESFTLKRRYGIALNASKLLVVSSAPTYASLDSIIIAEVKQLLASKGLIKYTQSDYSIQEEEIINDVKSYLYDDDISMDIDYNVDSEETQLDSPDNENDNDGIGLNAFINKLNGGKALRKRVRAARIKNNEALVKSLKTDDPEGKYSSERINKIQAETKGLEKEQKLESLENEKKKYIAISIASPSVAGKILALKKIKEIDQEIKKVKNS